MDKSIPLPAPQRNVISSGMLAMIFFLAAEVMFFAGLISAYIVNRSVADAMPELQQAKLPVEMTAVNTLFLLFSGVTAFLFSKRFKAGNPSRLLLTLTLVLGSLFLFLQGAEWVKLLSNGFSTSSNIYGAFFYTIIGAHAVHVVIGLVILLYLFLSLKQNQTPESSKNKIAICSLYWYFVVGIWPVLYVMVYLS